jgi:bifunctional non-homologous end joining protein LigD
VAELDATRRTRSATASPAPGQPAGANELPRVSPQLAVLVERPPSGPEWVHEIKLDGYRLLAYRHGPRLALITRGGEDWRARLPALARALADPSLADCVLDGELCAIAEDGVSRFEPLQQAFASGRTEGLVYVVFDLPIAHGQDLRDAPLLERKRALTQLLAGLPEPQGGPALVREWAHVCGDGPQVLAQACALGAEGIISKRVDGRYAGRRTRAWLKAKCLRRMSLVVAGLSPPKGSRRHFGALLLGSWDARGQLRYRGKVGAGLSGAALAELAQRLAPLERADPALVDPPAPARGVRWVEPRISVEVEYVELTEQGRLRHPRFVAAHPSPEASARETAKPGPAVRLTHPNKPMYPAFQAANGATRPALSKRDVADYIIAVSAWMLPHLRDRPLTLVRCPEGIAEPCFYQRQATPGLPAGVVWVPMHDGPLGICVRDPLGLLGLVQMSVLELHPWGARFHAPEPPTQPATDPPTEPEVDWPDRLVFDLDPDPELPFTEVIAAAIEVRDRLAELGLRSFVKTTGGKGLHVVVPVAPRYRFGPSKQFCKAFAQRMVAASPSRYVAIASKAARRGKIFIDYLRNGHGATSIAAYSLRARPGAPVSTPLAWEELDADLRPDRFDMLSVPARLANLARDPWAEIETVAQSIGPAAAAAIGLELASPDGADGRS